MSQAPIGIIDSGLGGLTILREIQHQLPTESLQYFGDTANCPYGGRTSAEISELSMAMIGQLVNSGAKAIVVACNTISVTCIHDLRSAFPSLPIVGTAPVIKTAASISKNRRIGILSTLATANSPYLAGMVAQFAPDCTVTNLGTNDLVPRIEQGAFASELPAILPEVLAPFISADIDALVLGCSHYPILRYEMQAILGPNVAILDSAAAIARQLGRVLNEQHLGADTLAEPTYTFSTSAPSPALELILDRLGVKTAARV